MRDWKFRRSEVLWLALLLTAGPMFAGCGKPKGPVRAAVAGMVTYDGEPVEDGSISFIPTGGTKGPSAGATITFGQYELSADQGPVVGTHRVEILANRRTGEKVPAVPPATGLREEIEQFLPAKFNQESTLTAEIGAGTNPNTDFVLKSK